MVDARIYKVGIEALAESPVRLGVTKQSVEVLSQFAATSDAPIRVYKCGIELLRQTPPELGVTKQSVEILSQFAANDAQVSVQKLGIEILFQNKKVIQTTKQSVEVLAQNVPNAAPINLSKLGIEVLFRSGPLLTAPASLPSYWDVFANNWAQEISMETAYDTDISRASTTLTEDRRGLRDRPYRMINFRWTGMSRTEIDRLMIFLRKLTEAQFFVPLYQDITEVTQISPTGPTEYTIYCNPQRARFFANQRVAVVQLDEGMLPTATQIYEIDEVHTDRLIMKTLLTQQYEPSTSVIFPCMDVEIILEPEVVWVTDQVGNVNLQAHEITATTALPPVWTGDPEDIQFYDGIPVFSWEPDWSTTPQITWKREGNILTKGRGIEPYLQGARYRALHHYTIREDRDVFWNYLKFFDSRRGRRLSFWHIDQENIWRVSNINGVFVEIFEFGDFTEFQDDFDYVGIVTKTGEYYVRKVITIQDVLGVYRLTCDVALPTIAPTDVLRVSRARLSRYMKDAMTELWKGNEYVQIPVDVLELLAENNVEMS
jgi:hypothetical protein